MHRRKLVLVLVCSLLAGCNIPAASDTPTPEASLTPETSMGCYYVWATQPLPELSRKINAALQELDPAVTGGAYAFGEDCIYEDGHARFSAMETDFRILVQAGTLKDEELLGGWIRKVMTVLEGLSPADLPGPQPGRVEFTFEKNKNEQLRLQVPIREYRSLPGGITDAELFRHFHPTP